MTDPEAVPSPMSPVAGPEDPSIRLAEVETATTTPIEAPSIEAFVSAEFDTSIAEAKAWQANAVPVMDSAPGYGTGGYTIYQPDLDHDNEWPLNMSFPHQGP
jgi:hypothetical protein